MVRFDGIGVSVPVTLWAGCLSLIPIGFAYFGITLVSRSINANLYSLIDILVSPAVTLLGFLIFREIPESSMLYGGALLLGAGAWLTREMSRTNNTGQR